MKKLFNKFHGVVNIDFRSCIASECIESFIIGSFSLLSFNSLAVYAIYLPKFKLNVVVSIDIEVIAYFFRNKVITKLEKVRYFFDLH